jgi:2-polyprenyl-3-methyl-5-hydroxy-6-metoxy-1,4-benzoquinol methylase
LTEDLNCEVVGIDLVPDFIEHCRQKKADYGTFICVDFCAMSPSQLEGLGRFDVVTALEVIEHSIDVRRFRENVGHVLKSGGKLIITTPHPKGIIGYGFMREHPCHVRMWSRWRLEQVFGPLTAYEPEIRNSAGELVSIGGVFPCP